VSAVVSELVEQYSSALHEYCVSGGETGLLRAYQIGRRAVQDGLSVLEVAALHQEALGSALPAPANADNGDVGGRASEFLVESLAPFELTRRGLQDVSARLTDLNRGLQHRLETVTQEFESAQGQLQEHERLQQLKNEFICLVSHEVRTPLTSIHGALNLLKAGLGGELNEQGQQLLDVAYRNSQRVVRLVSDILDLQKIEADTMTFDMQPIEVAPFLEQALEASQAYAAQFGVTLSLGPVPEDACVRADGDRLMQVMGNLLSNAVKFSPRDRPVVIEAARTDGMVRVSVHDEGPGVPEEFRSRVFQKFAQASSSRQKEGSGLGLSICKAIIEHMGGRIGFETVPGGGTTFFFELPEWQTADASDEGTAWPDLG
jgi:signal transduction histidine kinase